MTGSTRDDCPFCGVPEERVLASNVLAFAMLDAFPVSPGHALIVPCRHLANFFGLTANEMLAIHGLLSKTREHAEQTFAPAGYNIGVNIGSAAGQTVAHTHIHFIPRYPGDVMTSEGGVRNVIPGKGPYRQL